MTGDELLFDACKKGQLKAVNGLIERILVIRLKPKANVNARDGDGLTPLFYAAMNNRKDIARTLIANGAVVNATDKNGLTPLHYATTQGHQEIIRLLVARGASINVKEKPGLTLVHRSDWVKKPTEPQAAADNRARLNVVSALSEAATQKIKSAKSSVLVSHNETGVRTPSQREGNDGLPWIPIDKRLARVGDVNVFIYDERDRLLSGKRRRDDSTAVVWDLLKKYGLYRGFIVCDHVEKARAILMFATGESSGLQDMVGEICRTPEGTTLVIGGDLRKAAGNWFSLVEMLIRRREELGIIEASFVDMGGETSIIIEKSTQRRLSNIGKALGFGNSKPDSLIG